MYKYHCENLRAINKAIKFTQLALRRAISENRSEVVDAFTMTLSQLTTCWVEVRIYKIVHEPRTFTNDEIDRVILNGSLEEKWLTTIDSSFCKAYSIRYTSNLNTLSKQLPITPRLRREKIREFITSDLAQSISLRNRIAHGQWKYAFNSNATSLSTDLTRELRLENIIKIQLKQKIFQTTADIIHDLAVSKPTFERDFDKHFSILEQQTTNFEKRSYDEYCEMMRAKYQRGVEKRIIS